jgi:hypothetical protein
MRRSVLSSRVTSVAVLLALGGCLGATQHVSEPFDHKVSAAGVTHVEVHNLAGEIRITGSNAPLVDVAGTKTANDATSLGNIVVQVRKEGDTLTVATQYADGTHGGVRYDISLPAAVSLDVTNAAGTVTINGIRGNVTVSTKVGTIDADLGTVGTNRSVDLSTSAGRVRLSIADDSSARVDARTAVGDISTDFSGISVTRENVVSVRASGTIGAGAGTIHLSTATGAITLSRSP